MNLVCARCKTAITKRSKTGYCRSCYSRMLVSDPYHAAKMAEGHKRKLATDVAYREKRAEIMRINRTKGGASEKRREQCLTLFRDPEVKARNAAAVRAANLRHIPRPMWDLYGFCRKKKKMSKAEATALVLAEFRRIDPVAADVFEGVNVVKMPRRYTGWQKTIADVAAAFGLTFEDVMGGSRIAPRPDARAVCAMLFLDKGWSTTMVAGRIGLTDHTTVVHYRKTWAKRCKTRPIVGEVYARFCAERLAA